MLCMETQLFKAMKRHVCYRNRPGKVQQEVQRTPTALKQQNHNECTVSQDVGSR